MVDNLKASGTYRIVYQENLAAAPGEFSIDPHLGVGGGWLRSLADKISPPTPLESANRPYRTGSGMGGSGAQPGATFQDAIIGLTSLLTNNSGNAYINPILNPYSGLPNRTPSGVEPLPVGEFVNTDAESFGDDFNYPFVHPAQGVQDAVTGYIEQGFPMNFGAGQMTPLPTQQERRDHVPLTAEQRSQPSYLPWYDFVEK